MFQLRFECTGHTGWHGSGRRQISHQPKSCAGSERWPKESKTQQLAWSNPERVLTWRRAT